MSYDIIIVGAGPAGATIARLLPSSYHILLIDRLNKAACDQGKCCGGLLSPDAQAVLASQGLTLPKSVLCNPQIFAVDTWDMATSQQVKVPMESIVEELMK